MHVPDYALNCPYCGSRLAFVETYGGVEARAIVGGLLVFRWSQPWKLSA
jgi:hypothetical protein